MRLAVLADIHSNYHAFRACADWIEENNIDGIIFLGDYVSDCVEPQKTMQLMYMLKDKYKTWFVRGNREDVMISGRINPDMGSLVYTYKNLTKKDIDFFSTLPLSVEIMLDGTSVISAGHGGLHNNRENIFPDNHYCRKILEEMPGTLYLCGHSHNAFIYEKNGKIIVNPGSAGVPHDETPDVGMALIEWDNGVCRPQLLQIEYDVERTVREICESEFYLKDNAFARIIIATIRTGHDYKADAGALHAKYMSDGFSDNQSLWDKIVNELGI